MITHTLKTDSKKCHQYSIDQQIANYTTQSSRNSADRYLRKLQTQVPSSVRPTLLLSVSLQVRLHLQKMFCLRSEEH